MDIVPIKGVTEFTINLDPSVWIFDKRKMKLDEFKRTGEIVTVPERETDGSYAVPFSPFLEHAKPQPSAKRVIIHQQNGRKEVISLQDAYAAVLAFAVDGKPISDGPVHVYFGGDKHGRSPIAHVTAFEVTS
jgi:hypothetical protein